MAVGLEDTVALTPPDVTLSERRGAPPASATPRLGAGKQLGHFRIERLLGAGGMGEVYLATDLALDRPVAIKVLPEEAAGRADRRERLVREARAQARISHPNVAHIYFIGEEAGHLYFAMEYITGTTLADRVAAGPLPVDDAIAIMRSAALGLREAGRHGVTHRDVKPSNLMIDANGVVKILDFGLAAQHVIDDDGETTALEQTSVAGTPLYMAPEQACGDPIDLRADIYALGATLYHLVSGKPPFEADSADALRTKHATAVRPGLQRRSGQARATITAVEALCARMMAPDPDDRFASYDDLLRELELTSIEHTRPAGASVRMMATIVDLIAGAILAGIGAFAAEQLGYTPTINFNPVLLLAFGMIAAFSLVRFGRTLGQGLFELEVTEMTGARPRRWPAVVRVAIPLAVALAPFAIGAMLSLGDLELEPLADTIITLAMLIVPVALIWASLRVPGKRTFWDRASGTMVRYRMRRPTTL